MEYLINLGISGLKRILENQGFTQSVKVQENLKEYEENNNPILLFFQELQESDVVGSVTKHLYQKYAEFCISNSYQQLSNIEFSKQVKKFYDCEIKVTTVNGKTSRIFYKGE